MPAGTITALQAQASDSQRVSVFIDGAFALGISLSTLARERLFVGQQLSDADYERLARAEGADRAFHAALRALESRPRSIAEIQERLRRKGFEPEVIAATLSRLEELGLVDEESFARFWIENRQTYRPRGPGALRHELRRKGVSPAIIATALADDELVGDTREQAGRLARSALRKYAGAPDYATFSRRLGGYLQRRGFDSDTIRPILAELWGELRGAADEAPE